MSCYLVQERPERQLVAGYDRPLRQVFGRARGIAGTVHRTGPIFSPDTAHTAVARLSDWLREQGAAEADITRVAADLISDCEDDLS
ncbi:hypothetical protein MKK75_03220 [Methylobacterium sp. J-030]|uniref:hypothetical protein n=1 Tax=Methylobacterium sp. J-030 TaxID=2836627 RepID=UPI001FBA2C03|nr:hypothetical protein [Methylobacterium sp. J-030]MCJ2067827.1 hypothetical protein [Methylobacterium sp. J-030]